LRTPTASSEPVAATLPPSSRAAEVAIVGGGLPSPASITTACGICPNCGWILRGRSSSASWKLGVGEVGWVDVLTAAPQVLSEAG